MLESTYGHRHITYLDENKMYIKLFERKFEVLWKQKKAKLPKMEHYLWIRHAQSF